LSKSKQPARLVQQATGWNYTRCLRFVASNAVVASSYAAAEGVPIGAAYVAVAIAELQEPADDEGGVRSKAVTRAKGAAAEWGVPRRSVASSAVGARSCLPCGCMSQKQHASGRLAEAEAHLHPAFPDEEIANMLDDLGPRKGAAERVALRRMHHRNTAEPEPGGSADARH